MGRYLVSDKAASDLTDIEDGHLERGGSQENADLLILGLLESFQNIATVRLINNEPFEGIMNDGTSPRNKRTGRSGSSQG